MKKIIILLFFPFYIYGQNVNNYSEKIIVSEFNIRENNSIQIRKTTQVLKDTNVISETYWRCVLKPNDPNAFKVLGDYEEYLNLAIETWKDIPDSLGTYNTNEVTDSAQYIGNWRLNIKGQITNGKVKINANNKFTFNSNLNQPKTTNIPLNIKTNLIRINIDGVKYLLIKYGDGKFATVDGDVRLIKLE